MWETRSALVFASVLSEVLKRDIWRRAASVLERVRMTVSPAARSIGFGSGAGRTTLPRRMETDWDEAGPDRNRSLSEREGVVDRKDVNISTANQPD